MNRNKHWNIARLKSKYNLSTHGAEQLLEEIQELLEDRNEEFLEMIGEDEDVCPGDVQKELDAGCTWCNNRMVINKLKSELRQKLTNT